MAHEDKNSFGYLTDLQRSVIRRMYDENKVLVIDKDGRCEIDGVVVQKKSVERLKEAGYLEKDNGTYKLSDEGSVRLMLYRLKAR